MARQRSVGANSSRCLAYEGGDPGSESSRNRLAIIAARYQTDELSLVVVINAAAGSFPSKQGTAIKTRERSDKSGPSLNKRIPFSV